jgi:predicted ATP-dependent serine protease
MSTRPAPTDRPFQPSFSRSTRVSPLEGDSTRNLRNPRGAQGCTIQPLVTYTVDELEADPNLADGVQWVVDGLIPQGGLTILYGIGKGGKTTFLSHLAAAVVLGQPFIDRDVRQGPVLWVDLEQHLSLTKETLVNAGARGREVHVYNGIAPDLRALEAKIREVRATLVVIDSLSKLLQLRDENDASQVNNALTPLLQMIRETNVATVAIHHDRKREGDAGRGMRGSTVFLATLDVCIGLKREGGTDSTQRRLEVNGRYPGAGGTFIVELTAEGYKAVGEKQSVLGADALEKLGTDSLTADEWALRLGVSRQATQKKAEQLVKEGKVTKTGTGKRGDAFRFSRVPDGATSSAPGEVAALQQQVPLDDDDDF